MEQWTGNLELSSELHLPAENRFIGGLIILHFFSTQHSKKQNKAPSCGLKLMQNYKIQLKMFNDLYVCTSQKLEN